MNIKKSEPKYHQILSNIAKESKAFWDYPGEWLELWEEDLTVSEEYIQKNNVFHSENDGEISGFYSYYPEDENVRLEHLFIHPKYIGKNVGKLLINDFFERINNENFQKIILDADPNAVVFYEKFGFENVDRKLTKIEGRFLPVMIKNLE